MQNMLYTGDNLYILNGMNSETVDLIYLDPPFNSKRIYSAPIGSKAAGASFKDMWKWKDVDEEYLNGLRKYPELVDFIYSIGGIHSKGMMSYITYMAQRIIQLHRVLKSTGSFYIHCDPTASHYLKIMMDEIFGQNNFRNEIIWERIKAGKQGKGKSRRYGACHDTILFYTKTDKYEIHAYRDLTKAETDKKFNKVSADGRRYYDDSSHIFRPMGLGEVPSLCFEWRGFTAPNPSGWTMTKENLEKEYQKGNFLIRENGKLERRKYIDDYRGFPLNSNWSDIPPASGNERTGYPTQKPLALLNRIINSSSKEGDIVLDPFCGCATTCVASQMMQRKWIGIDIEAQAATLLVERLSDDGGMFKDFVRPTKLPERTDIKYEKSAVPIKDRLFKEQKGICNGCKEKFNIVNFEIDHIMPRSKGGGDYYENFQLLCGNCNRVKGNRPMEELIARLRKRAEAIKKVSY